MSAEDRTIVCVECSQSFVFTAGEQEFYQTKGLMNEPRRCPDCRNTRRRERHGEREMHEGVLLRVRWRRSRTIRTAR